MILAVKVQTFSLSLPAVSSRLHTSCSELDGFSVKHKHFVGTKTYFHFFVRIVSASLHSSFVVWCYINKLEHEAENNTQTVSLRFRKRADILII